MPKLRPGPVVWASKFMDIIVTLLIFIVIVLSSDVVAGRKVMNSSNLVQLCSSAVANSIHGKDEGHCWLSWNRLWEHDENLTNAKHRLAKYIQSTDFKSTNSSTDVIVYIHGFVMQTEINGGITILKEILDHIVESGLHERALSIRLVGTGAIESIRNCLNSNSSYNSSIELVDDLHDLSYFYEYPTLSIMQHHARHLHEHAKILYLHTKGATKPHDKSRAFIRACMLHFSVTLFPQSLKLLDVGWQSTGIQYINATNHRHYAGNFFWLQAAIAAENRDIMDLVWYWRFGAEKWPLHQMDSCRIFQSKLNARKIWKYHLEGRAPSALPDYHLAVIVPPDCPTMNASSPYLDYSNLLRAWGFKEWVSF